jgi:hypothetical protein
MKKITLLFAILLMSMMANTISAQTTLETPTIGTATRITLTGFTANWTAVANATSYSINVYDGSNALVSGSPKSVTGSTSSTLAITAMLLPNTTYSYTVTAIGDGVTYISSTESSKSTTFTTATSSGTFTLQYAASDAATLNKDIIGGAADIYELTTSGGAYTFNTTSTNNNTLIRNTTIKASAGLALKPILKLSSTTTGATANMFYTATLGLTITFNGIEFDGGNAGGTGQPILFYDSNAGASNIKLYINNCLIRGFKNSGGNGTIRSNAEGSTSQLIDIQNSVFNDCGGRILYLNSTTNPTLCDISIKNTTFSNNSLLTLRANVIYSAKANTGTTLFDHCTLFNLVTTSTSEGTIKYPTGSGAITITNSIFSGVAQTLPAATISYCYLGGLTTPPTGTNTFTTTPVFTNASGLDFSLTNKTLFICADASFAGNAIYYSALPKLNIPVVGTASNVSTNSFTANWTAVANATGYDVKVYDGTSTLVNTISVTGQATSSAAVTGILRATTYTYKVIAKGDALTYNSSDPSAASVSFTTLGLTTPIAGSPTNITTSALTANWTTVTNASSYDVKLYVNSYLVSTTNVSGQASTSLLISGLNMGTTYYYTVTAKGDGVTYLDSEPSVASTVAKTLAVTVSQINPDFSDGSWGTVSSTSISLGSFPTFSANGFDLTKAYIQTTAVNGLKGEVFANMLKLDKTQNSGVLDLPTVASVSQLEIRASATTGRQFTLSIWNSGTSAWDLYGTYTTTVDTENIFLINFASLLTNAKFRIIDISSGAFSFYKIKTLTTQPVALSAPTVGAGSNITSTGFTANWTGGNANTTGYKVFVYKANTLVNTTTASGQATQSLAITGLQADSIYTYKVSAVGDGDNLYSNSVLSGASGTIKTLTDLGTSVNSIKNVSIITVSGKSIMSSEIGNFELYNLQGAKLINEKETNIIYANLPKGLYIVRFKSTDNQITTQKLILN